MIDAPTGPDPDDRLYEQYERQMAFRRAFICERCYKALDTHYGTGAITAAGTAKRYSLSGDCRGGKAAVYDHAKWQRYQQRKAGELGIDLA
ncbi:MAG TPA: hypothetical protein VM243_05740 [Phycisphaerae bacterium]|nr:hypothetical protein [Phycisphaerae bacterium]